MKSKLTSLDSPGLADGAAVRKFSKARVLAPRFGICAKTLFRLADRGLIDRFKLNSRVVVFDEAQVAQLFEAARVNAGRK
jgi:hypothetical protein